MTTTVDRHDVLCFRVRRHQLDRGAGAARGPTDVDLLDAGVQDTGPDGSAWALAVRGAPPAGVKCHWVVYKPSVATVTCQPW